MSGAFPSARAAAPQLSVVVPAHNSGAALALTVQTLSAYLSGRVEAEIILVENGSRDRTWLVAQSLARLAVGLELPDGEGRGRAVSDHAVPVRACQSAVGLGAAYAEGIRRARGRVVLLTADDLPFGTSDLDGWSNLQAIDLPVSEGSTASEPALRLDEGSARRDRAVVIGSKAHPDSVVPRPLARRILTRVFGGLRRVVLGMRIGDTQGTLFVPRDWAVDMVPRLGESGYLFSTEVILAAELQGLDAIELPVTYAPAPGAHGTRIRPHHVASMVLGMLRLRRRRASLSGRPGNGAGPRRGASAGVASAQHRGRLAPAGSEGGIRQPSGVMPPR